MKQVIGFLSGLFRALFVISLLFAAASPVKADQSFNPKTADFVQVPDRPARFMPDPANQPPVAVNDSGAGFVTFTNRSFITSNVLTNDSDPNGDLLFVKSFDASQSKGQIQYLYPGSSDGGFGVDGKVNTKFGFSGMGQALLLQSDGKFIVVGRAFLSGTGMVFALARYHPNGSLDESFGVSGKLTTGFTNGGAAFGAALQLNGKIIAVGCAMNNQFALARYNQDGSLDQSFGAGGLVLTNFSNFSDCAYSVAIQTDEKIVAAGISSPDADHSKFALARYNSNGSLDTSFGTQGKVTTNFTASIYDEGSAVAIQTDGKILVAGDSDANLAIVRYDEDGTLDTSFGSGGKVTRDTNHLTLIPAIALQTDGKILLAQARTGGPLYLARYNLNGAPDITFGTNGLATTDLNDCVGGSNPGLLVQANGKIMVATSCNQPVTIPGNYQNNPLNAGVPFSVLRYNSNGSLDGSFGVGGIVTTSFNGTAMPHGIVLQPDSKIIVAGQSDDGFSIARYLNDGSFFYNPNGQFDHLASGEQENDAFTYVASNGVLTDTATVTVTILGGVETYLPLATK